MYRRRRTILRAHRRLPAAAVPLSAAGLLSVLFFLMVTSGLRPMVRTIAVSKATNMITAAIGEETMAALNAEQLQYPDFVNITTNDEGEIVSLSFDTVKGAAFRNLITTQLVRRFEGLDPDDLAIPAGDLTGVLVFASLGPSIRVRIRSVGDVTAALENEFVSAGVNQTKHTVCLRVSAVIYLLIPGEIVPVSIEERVCLAETVIVGRVPDTFLNLQQDGEI